MSSSPIGDELCSSSFNQDFQQHSSHFLYRVTIGGAFGYFITFGQVFPSFCLRRGKVGQVREETKLEMGNISDAVTSFISFLTTPWAAILRGLYMVLGFWCECVTHIPELVFLASSSRAVVTRQRRKLILFVRNQASVGRLLKLCRLTTMTSALSCLYSRIRGPKTNYR